MINKDLVKLGGVTGMKHKTRSGDRIELVRRTMLRNALEVGKKAASHSDQRYLGACRAI